MMMMMGFVLTDCDFTTTFKGLKQNSAGGGGNPPQLSNGTLAPLPRKEALRPPTLIFQAPPVKGNCSRNSAATTSSIRPPSPPLASSLLLPNKANQASKIGFSRIGLRLQLGGGRHDIERPPRYLPPPLLSLLLPPCHHGIESSSSVPKPPLWSEKTLWQLETAITTAIPTDISERFIPTSIIPFLRSPPTPHLRESRPRASDNAYPQVSPLQVSLLYKLPRKLHLRAPEIIRTRKSPLHDPRLRKPHLRKSRLSANLTSTSFTSARQRQYAPEIICTHKSSLQLLPQSLLRKFLLPAPTATRTTTAQAKVHRISNILPPVDATIHNAQAVSLARAIAPGAPCFSYRPGASSI